MHARIFVRTRRRWFGRAESSATSRGCRKSPARSTRRRFHSNQVKCQSGEDYRIKVYPVKVEMDTVFLSLYRRRKRGVIALDQIEVPCTTACAVACG